MLIGVEEYPLEDIRLAYEPYRAKEFVWRHRNIFSKSSRRYIEWTMPPCIKEVDTAPDGTKQWWFWWFLPEGRYRIYKFNSRPTGEEWSEMVNEIYEITRRR